MSSSRWLSAWPAAAVGTEGGSRNSTPWPAATLTCVYSCCRVFMALLVAVVRLSGEVPKVDSRSCSRNQTYMSHGKGLHVWVPICGM